MTDFTYDVRAQFDAASQPGFDTIRIRTGSRPHLKRLEMGLPLQVVEPTEVIEGDNELVVHLPQSVTRDRNEPVRLVFGTEVFIFANTFAGEVFDTGEASLPQQIEAGNATDEVSTNSLRVLGGAQEAGTPIEDLVFSSKVLTPNGDGANDVLAISYTLFLLPAPVPVAFTTTCAASGSAVAKSECKVPGRKPCNGTAAARTASCWHRVCIWWKSPSSRNLKPSATSSRWAWPTRPSRDFRCPLI